MLSYQVASCRAILCLFKGSILTQVNVLCRTLFFFVMDSVMSRLVQSNTLYRLYAHMLTLEINYYGKTSYFFTRIYIAF